MAVTDPLRAEHVELRPQLDALDSLAADLSRPAPDVPARLAEAVAFLQEHLVPHARAEEAALYPAVEQALSAPGATATMAADHREITRRIDQLAASVPENEDQLGDQQRESLRAQLYGLSAILHLHFAKEEDVLLPVLDAHLDAQGATDLFTAMGHAAHSEKDPSPGDHDH
jgi:iron-sulfur cluster repair protein YtfE (RIC family)